MIMSRNKYQVNSLCTLILSWELHKESSLKKSGNENTPGSQAANTHPHLCSCLCLSGVTSSFILLLSFVSWQKLLSLPPLPMIKNERPVFPQLMSPKFKQKKRWPASGNTNSENLGEELKLTHVGRTHNWCYNICLEEGIYMTHIGHRCHPPPSLDLHA